MKKIAFITGITGQDGSFLAQLLLNKKYKIIGLVSDKNDIGLHNIINIQDKLILEKGDLLDFQSLERIVLKYKPSEIYNLAGITYVPTSWKIPVKTLDVNTNGLLRIIKVITTHKINTKLFQANSATIFGQPKISPQNEKTLLNPQNPYSISKAASHFISQVYRKQHNLFITQGILYNHESEKRGLDFVTRKITNTAVKIKLKKAKELSLGNLEAKRDWGYAPDYVQAMYKLLQQKKPDDYIIATGKLHSVKDIVQIAFNYLNLDWRKYVTLNKDFYRPESKTPFQGDISKIKKDINWTPTTSFKTMIEKMLENDLKLESKKGTKE